VHDALHPNCHRYYTKCKYEYKHHHHIFITEISSKTTTTRSNVYSGIVAINFIILHRKLLLGLFMNEVTKLEDVPEPRIVRHQFGSPSSTKSSNKYCSSKSPSIILRSRISNVRRVVSLDLDNRGMPVSLRLTYS
jgi:hypothetical protein